MNVYSEAAIVLYTWDISGRKTFSYSRSLLSSIKETMKNKNNKQNYIVYKRIISIKEKEKIEDVRGRECDIWGCLLYFTK